MVVVGADRAVRFALLALLCQLSACADPDPTACAEAKSGFALDGQATLGVRDLFGAPAASGGTTTYVGPEGATTWRWSLHNEASVSGGAALRVLSVHLEAVDGRPDDGLGVALTCFGPGAKACADILYPTLLPAGFDPACVGGDTALEVAVEVRFDPKAASAIGTRRLVIEVAGDPSLPKGRWTHDIEVVSGAPYLSCGAAPAMEFGEVSTGAKATKTLTCINAGESVLRVHKVEMLSLKAAPFVAKVGKSAVQMGQPAVGEALLELAAGASTTIEAHIDPMPSQEEFSATLRLWTNMANNGGKFDVGLGVNRNSPCLQPSPSSLDFGDVGIGYPKALEVALQTCGKPPVNVTDISFDTGSAGGLALDFATGWFVDDVAPSPDKPAVSPPKLIFRVICNPTSSGDMKGSVKISAQDVDAMTIPVSCRGIEPPCPHACIDLPPESTVKQGQAKTLTAACSQSGDGAALAKFQWTVLRPDGQSDTLTPSPSAPAPVWTPTVLGKHVAQLVVSNGAHVPSSAPACDGGPALRTVVVGPDYEVYATVRWTAPGVGAKEAEGYSVNLHLADSLAAAAPGQQDLDGDGQPDPWYAPCHDVWFLNPNPPWGLDAKLSDDPHWAKLAGAPPGEGIGIQTPTAGEVYRVGVYAYFAGKTTPDLVPTVTIWIGDVLVWQKTGAAMKWRDMWDVGAVHWPGGVDAAKFVPTADEAGGAVITAGYTSPSPSMTPACP